MGAGGKDASQIQSEVKEYYGETLATTSDLKTNACCTAEAPPPHVRDALAKLEPGKLADLVVLDENPLQDLYNSNTVRWVMKNGRMYEGDTLNQTWPEQRAAEGFYWQNTGSIPVPATRNE